MAGVLLQRGDTFLDFVLRDLSGTARSTEAARNKGLLAVAFFKVNCPTCQLAFPYLQRLADMYPDLTVWGVSQNDLMETREFARQYRTRFPILLDSGLEVTDRFELQTVPAVYVTDESGKVLDYIGAWSRDFVNSVAARVAERTGVELRPVITETDPAPPFTPG